MLINRILSDGFKLPIAYEQIRSIVLEQDRAVMVTDSGIYVFKEEPEPLGFTCHKVEHRLP